MFRVARRRGLERIAPVLEYWVAEILLLTKKGWEMERNGWMEEGKEKEWVWPIYTPVDAKTPLEASLGR